MCAFGVPRWEKAGKTKVNEWLGYDICWPRFSTVSFEIQAVILAWVECLLKI
jgi:hypothetical protein